MKKYKHNDNNEDIPSPLLEKSIIHWYANICFSPNSLKILFYSILFGLFVFIYYHCTVNSEIQWPSGTESNIRTSWHITVLINKYKNKSNKNEK